MHAGACFYLVGRGGIRTRRFPGRSCASGKGRSYTRIYSILFLYRQHLELALKALIRDCRLSREGR